jgi:hypothetical protein
LSTIGGPRVLDTIQVCLTTLYHVFFELRERLAFNHNSPSLVGGHEADPARRPERMNRIRFNLICKNQLLLPLF